MSTFNGILKVLGLSCVLLAPATARAAPEYSLCIDVDVEHPDFEVCKQLEHLCIEVDGQVKDFRANYKRQYPGSKVFRWEHRDCYAAVGKGLSPVLVLEANHCVEGIYSTLVHRYVRASMWDEEKWELRNWASDEDLIVVSYARPDAWLNENTSRRERRKHSPSEVKGAYMRDWAFDGHYKTYGDTLAKNFFRSTNGVIPRKPYEED